MPLHPVYDRRTGSLLHYTIYDREAISTCLAAGNRSDGGEERERERERDTASAESNRERANEGWEGGCIGRTAAKSRGRQSGGVCTPDTRMIFEALRASRERARERPRGRKTPHVNVAEAALSGCVPASVSGALVTGNSRCVTDANVGPSDIARTISHLSKNSVLIGKAHKFSGLSHGENVYSFTLASDSQKSKEQ